MAKLKKAIAQAYATVNRLKPNQVEDEVHVQRAQTALMQVATYPECFECESEEDRDERLELRGPENGEFAELAQHFKALRPEFKGTLGSYAVVFTMQNEIDGVHAASDHVESEAVDMTNISEDRQTESPKRMNEVSADEQDTSSENNIIKEGLKMAEPNVSSNLIEEEEARMLAEGAKIMGTTGSSMSASGSMPNDAAISTEEALTLLKANKAAIFALMENSRVLNVVFGRPTLSKILAHGEETMGTIADPRATLKKFEETVGYVEATGEYSRVENLEVEGAKAVHNALKEAVENPSKEFKINIGKGGPSIKGWNVQLPGEDKPKLMTVQQVKEFMINQAAGVLYILKDEKVQLQLKSVKRRNQTATGKATKTVANDTSDPLKGLVGLAISGRRDENKNDRLLGIALYHKEIDQTKAPEKKSGPKSDLHCKYLKPAASSTEKTKSCTYRIPLVAEQYQVVVLDAELKAAFGAGDAGVGTTQPFDLSDAASADKLLASMAEQIAAYAGKASDLADDSYAKKVKEASANAAAKRAESDAADVEENL